MPDLTKRGAIAAPPPLPKGLAFGIAELVLVKGWAEQHDFCLVLRLDYGAPVNEDYEEVIALHTKASPLYRLILWRDATTVFVQPLVGRRKQYDTVLAALESIRPKQGVILTDIVTTGTWLVRPRQ
jgi:hypothetical protein